MNSWMQKRVRVVVSFLIELLPLAGMVCSGVGIARMLK
jgi:hypothetical protein